MQLQIAGVGQPDAEAGHGAGPQQCILVALTGRLCECGCEAPQLCRPVHDGQARASGQAPDGSRRQVIMGLQVQDGSCLILLRGAGGP